MAWVTIPDTEIEPEKPVTSILLHKLRDNPEAIAAGLAGAPKILTPAYNALSVTGAAIAANAITVPKISIDLGMLAVTTSGVHLQVVAPGGKTGFWIATHYTGTLANGLLEVQLNYLANGQLTGISTPYVTYEKAASTATILNFTQRYILPHVALFYWFYRQSSLADPAEKSSWFSGLSLSSIVESVGEIDHPFFQHDPATQKMEVIAIDPILYEELKIRTVPIVGGGWMTPELWEGDPVPDIDTTRPERSIIEVIEQDYTITPGGTWPTDPQYIKHHPLMPNTVLMEVLPVPVGVDICELIPA